MKLSVLERLMLQTILPKEGSFTNLKLLRLAKEALSFSDAEHKILNFREVQVGDETRTAWDQGVQDKDIKFGEIATQMIVKELKKLDETNKLTDELISVYEKFVENKGE